MSIANAALAHVQWPHLGIRWTKGRFEADIQYEGALANPEEHPVERAGSGDETASDIGRRRVGGARS